MTRAVALAALGLAALAGGCAGHGAGGQAPGPPPAAAAPPPAAAEVRSAAFVIVADTPSGTATASVAPGGTASLGFRVANGSGAARTFALSTTVPWLSVPARVSVPPRQSVPVAATARVGDDVPPGVLRAEVAASPAARADSRIAVVYESRAPVSVRVVAR